jgi:DNA-binding transcriptional regulator GbsR (MarR family)
MSDPRPRGAEAGASSTPAVESSPSEDVVRQFVEHWGVMARSWGINATMGELFALLYITGTDWTADGLRERLRVSRGNVSMNLRELIAWGVVYKVHRQGERREFYRAEADVWTLFRRILVERKRRELDPTLVVLDRAARNIQDDPALSHLRDRVVSLQRFFALTNTLATRLAELQPDELENLRLLLDPLPTDAVSTDEEISEKV